MSSVDFPASSGQISFNVTTDGTYELSKDGTWFGYVKNGNTITVVSSGNTTGAGRSGALLLKMTGLDSATESLTIPVTQSVSDADNVKVRRIIMK